MYLIHERDLTGEPHRSPTLGLAYQATVGQKILKSPGQKKYLIKSKSRIKKRVLLKNVKHDEGFPTFQKKNLHIKPGIGNNVLVYHFFGFFEIKIFY